MDTYLDTSLKRYIKRELFWRREWTNKRELSIELNKWIEYYNNSYLHSAHGYRTPIQAEGHCYNPTSF
jgi:putative transposase